MSATRGLEWFERLPCAVTVCDRRYTILYLNARAAQVHASEGGRRLVGKNLIDCHPPEAQRKLKKVMAEGRPNVYTIEKNGVRKMIYQSHWRRKGRVAGMVEISFELPDTVPHFVRS
jgi:PAS domain-containing protein